MSSAERAMQESDLIVGVIPRAQTRSFPLVSSTRQEVGSKGGWSGINADAPEISDSSDSEQESDERHRPARTDRLAPAQGSQMPRSRPRSILKRPVAPQERGGREARGMPRYDITDSESESADDGEVQGWEMREYQGQGPGTATDADALAEVTPRLSISEVKHMDIDSFMHSVDKTMKKFDRVQKIRSRLDLTRPDSGSSSHAIVGPRTRSRGPRAHELGGDRMEGAFRQSAAEAMPSSVKRKEQHGNDYLKDEELLAEQAEEMRVLQERHHAVVTQEKHQRAILERLRRQHTRTKDRFKAQQDLVPILCCVYA